MKYVDENGLFDNRLPETQFRKSIATLYKKFNQPEEALKQYLLLTKLEPTVADNYFQAAQIYDSNGRYNEALGFYDKTLKFDKKNVKAHAATGLLLYRAKQINEAKRAKRSCWARTFMRISGLCPFFPQMTKKSTS